MLMKTGRRGSVTLTTVAEVLHLSAAETLKILDLLIAKGYLYRLEDAGDQVYRVRFGQKRGRELPLAVKNSLQQRQAIQLIEVQSDLGAGTRGADLGAAALKTASFEFNRKFFDHHPIQEIESRQYQPELAAATPHAKGIEAIYEVYCRVSAAVQSALQQGQLPVVISGDHSTAGGTLAGIKMTYPESRLGVVWIDAHADIHTPYTTPSGNMHGMPVATALGEDNLACRINQPNPQTVEYWNQIKQLGGISPKLAHCDLVYVAVRDTEPQEDALIAAHQIRNITTAEVRSKGTTQVTQEILERLTECDRIYVSFDVDSMDPDVVSAGTGTPVADGLTDTEAGQLISLLIASGKVCCFEICEINSSLDGRGNRMAQSAFGILESAATRLSFQTDGSSSPVS
jgi:arginase